MRKTRFWTAIVTAVALAFTAVPPAIADVPVASVTGSLTSASNPLILAPLVGQSTVAVEVSASTGLTLSFKELVKNSWVPTTCTSPDQTVTDVSSTTSVGTLLCTGGGAAAFEVVPSGSGTATVTILANGGTSKVIGAGVNGGKTIVAGSGNITVTNAGNTATVGIVNNPTFSGITTVGSLFDNTLTPGTCVGAAAGPELRSSTNCVTSITAGTNVSITGTSSNPIINVSATPAPVSVTAGTGIAVATPSPGVFVVSNTGLLSATGSGNISVTTGATPVVSITNAPTFTGPLSASTLTASGSSASSGQCVQFGVGGILSATGTACGSGSGTVTAVTGTGNIASTGGTTPQISITAAPTFAGAVTASQFNGSGAGLTSATIPNAALVTSPVTSVSGSGNIASTGGLTPTVSITNAPTFTGALSALSLTGTGLTNGNCVQASTGGLLTTTSGPCAAGTLTGLTAGSNIVVGAGPTPSVAVTNSPTFTGALSAASLTGTGLTSGNCVQASTGGLLTTAAAKCVTSVTGTGNISVSAGPTPVVSITAAPTFSGLVTSSNNFAAGVPGTSADTSGNGIYYIANSTAVAPFQTVVASSSLTANKVSGIQGDLLLVGNAGGPSPSLALDVSGNLGLKAGVIGTNLTASSLTSGQCVQTTTGGQLTTTGAACGTGSGTVTAVTGTGNISSTGGTTPAISITNSPTFTGGTVTATQFLGGSSSTVGSGGVGFGSASGFGGYTNLTSTNTAGPQGVTGNILNVTDGNQYLFEIDTSGNSSILNSLTTPTLKSTSLTASSCVGSDGTKTLVSATNCVTSLTAGNNITLTGTSAAPTVAVTNAPTFAGTVTLSGNSANTCLQLNASKQIVSTASTCLVNTITSGSFVVPAIGSTVNVGVVVSSAFPKNGVAIQISDSTTAMNGIITAGAGTSGLTVLNTGVPLGAVGNTIASGQIVFPGASGTLTGITAGNNIVVTPNASGNSPTVAETASPTYTTVNATTVTSANFTSSGWVTSRCLQSDTTAGNAKIIVATTSCVPSVSPVFTGTLSLAGKSVPYNNSASTGTATHFESGSQSITAATGACTAGTLITFGTSFGTTPRVSISANSTALVWANISSPSTTGFTPVLCNTSGSSQTVTVYYMALGE